MSGERRLGSHALPIPPWTDLPALTVVYAERWSLSTRSIDAPRVAVARRLLVDAREAGGGSLRNRILNEAWDFERTTVGRLPMEQAVSVLNEVGATVAFYRSVLLRFQNNAPCRECLVCGSALADHLAQSRGIGRSCYGLVLKGIR